jgi:mono/diheme cytochrome c family protein
LGFTTFISHGQEHKSDALFSPVIPRTWDDEAMASLEVPLADPVGSPKHASADYYYRIPVGAIYKSYPIYAPGHEPPGYMDWLKRQEPEIIWGEDKNGQKHAPPLKTEADWIKAGEIVFDAPVAFATDQLLKDLRDPAFYEKVGFPLTNKGVNTFLGYVIRERGKIEAGGGGCATCHTRLMPDGIVIKGAQGNVPFDRLFVYGYRKGRISIELARDAERFFFAAPWLRPDPLDRLQQMSLEEIASVHEAIPPGIIARHRSSPFYPVQVPDLIGVKDRHYLDRTGLQQHHSIVDLMRYAALNQGGDDLASYDGFIPLGEPNFDKLPEPTKLPIQRYSDEQLYALALYLYALQPPPNPNKFDAVATHGQKVFEGEGCAACHTPPLYTNNKLTPVEGFKVPEDHLKKYEILPISVGTNPNLALKTRRGTGYYKVPSLKGVWYRSMLEHDGSCATLEDWFDPRRLHEDYVPTGFVGYGIKTRAVKGHEFGLDLSADDKRALIAFLKTL